MCFPNNWPIWSLTRMLTIPWTFLAISHVELVSKQLAGLTLDENVGTFRRWPITSPQFGPTYPRTHKMPSNPSLSWVSFRPPDQKLKCKSAQIVAKKWPLPSLKWPLDPTCLSTLCTMQPGLKKSVNRKIDQNVYLGLHFKRSCHFHFLIHWVLLINWRKNNKNIARETTDPGYWLFNLS